MYRDMLEVKQRNKAIHHRWFEESTMRFFNSRVGDTLYAGKYFISSEQFDYKSPRLYTVRIALESGEIDTIGKFQAYTSWESAKCAIDKLIESEKVEHA